jgi:hypothetical protein
MASPRPDPSFDPERLLELLRARAIRVVVVGAMAARIRGFVDLTTRAIDLVPDLEAANLQDLAEALHELGATIRIENETTGPVRLPADGGLLARAPILNLHVPGIGDVDLIHAAAAEADGRAPLTYEELVAQATVEVLPGSGTQVAVMSEEDWMHSKLAPPVREKDEIHLQLYRHARG